MVAEHRDKLLYAGELNENLDDAALHPTKQISQALDSAQEVTPFWSMDQ